jgi:hypothetical protein
MKYLRLVVEGSTEEAFVNEVLAPYFSPKLIITCRKIQTGWDPIQNKPAKGGLLKFGKFQRDVARWIEADRDKPECWYSSFIDLYAFPVDSESPFTKEIKDIQDLDLKINKLEERIAQKINHPRFIPYVQLHEFEAFVFIELERLNEAFPGSDSAIGKLEKEAKGKRPEEINESEHTAPSKRIIKAIPAYSGLKATVGPMIAHDLGMQKLRDNCPHFNSWITKLEALING